jgi:iron complex transport system substrate-binding protein
VRIVSLLPSATEFVCELGLVDCVVGISHACDYPPELLGKPVVTRAVLPTANLTSSEIDRAVSERRETGQTIYELDVDLLEQLQPDLILTQGLCDVCAVSHSLVRETLPRLSSPTRLLSLSPGYLVDLLSDVKTIGDYTGQQTAAQKLIGSLRSRLDRVAFATARADRFPRVLCLEWLDPPWIGGHWIPEMVGLAGGVDRLTTPGVPSRRAPWDNIASYAPEVVILMPCGFDLQRTLDEASRVRWPTSWQSLPAVRNGHVFAVDGSAYFNRPGPRLVTGVEILAELLHPELLSGCVPDGAARAL